MVVPIVRPITSVRSVVPVDRKENAGDRKHGCLPIARMKSQPQIARDAKPSQRVITAHKFPFKTEVIQARNYCCRCIRQRQPRPFDGEHTNHWHQR
jgi:hypothetical protein